MALTQPPAKVAFKSHTLYRSAISENVPVFSANGSPLSYYDAQNRDDMVHVVKSLLCLVYG